MIKKLIAWLVGKKLATETGELTVASKTKITAVIGVILGAIGPISVAWGHPIVIPDWVYKILAGAGLWSVRDAIKS